MKLKTNRIEALTDGIFAIVMTIMIISMDELIRVNHFAKEADYCILLASLWNDFASYAISFIILGTLWLVHHWQFHHISYIDPPIVFINIIWFMFICLIPFSTMIVGNHPNFFMPAIIFECNILIVFSILYLQWAYVIKRKHLVGASLDDKMILLQRNVVLSLIMVVILAIAVSYVYHMMRR